MTDRELMQQALDALESVTWHFTRTPSTLNDSEVRGEAHKAITALRARLAQPEPEPVAWMFVNKFDGGEYIFKDSFDDGVYNKDEFDVVPLYTTPPQREWQGLTDEDRADAWAQTKGDLLLRLLPFSLAIEAMLKEKNER